MNSHLKKLLAVAVLVAPVLVTGAHAAGNDAGNYRFHASQDQVQVHYDMDVQANGVQATGIIETSGSPVEDVTLEFVALDGAGNVLERHQANVQWGVDENAPQSFTIRLPHDSRAQRYELRIASYSALDQG